MERIRDFHDALYKFTFVTFTFTFEVRRPSRSEDTADFRSRR